MTARARTTAIVAVAFCALTAASLTRAFLDRGPGLAAGAATIVAGVTTILGWRRTRVGVTVGALTVAVVTVAAVVLADGAFPGDVVRTVTNGAGDLLTTRWPAAATPTAVGLVVLLGAAAGWLTAVAAARRSLGPTILLPGVALLAVGALLAAPAGPPGSPMLAAMTAAALATLRLAAIARHPDEGPATTGDLRTALSAQRFAALGALALVVAPLAAAPYTAGGERFDPRDSRDDPTNRFDDLSPLTVVEELRKIDPPVPVIQVDGNDVGSWRIAAMNRYDGRAWMAPEVFKPTTLRREDHRPDRTVRVTLRRPIGRWLPVPDGHVLAVDRSVRTEATNAGLLSESAVQSRERYTVSLDDPAAPTRPAAVDPNPKLRPTLSGYEPPLRVRQLASQVIAQAGTDEQRAEAIAQFLRREYRLDEESPAGHSALLIESFLFDTKRGRAEQFIGAYGLLATAAGLPVRLAAGFDVDPGTRTISSDDAVAWAEVAFRGGAWVRFNPVPDSEAPPAGSTDVAAAQPAVTAAPPPVPTTEPRNDPKLDTRKQKRATDERSVPWWLVLAVALPTAAVASYVYAVVALKRRRRAEHLDVPTDERRVVGAFRVCTDRLTDLGIRLQPSSTDRELVAAAAARVEAAGDLHGLAGLASAATYADGAIEPADVEAALATMSAFEIATRPTRWWRRLRLRLSLRSLRSGLPPTRDAASPS